MLLDLLLEAEFQLDEWGMESVSVALTMLLPVRWRSRRLMDRLALRESFLR